jgi:hypothetical protein
MQPYVDRSPILVRVRKPLKECAAVRARALGRSLNNYLEHLIKTDCGVEFPDERFQGEIDIDFLS